MKLKQVSQIPCVVYCGIPPSPSTPHLSGSLLPSRPVLDHYFYQNNVAPFLCVRIIQRFSLSNPSPRYVASCVDAFRTGSYTSSSHTFGDGRYGSLEAMAAAILLDKEATDGAIATDPIYGSIREPIIKVIHLMRSMHYQTSLPADLKGAPMQETYHVKLWQIDRKIGQG